MASDSVVAAIGFPSGMQRAPGEFGWRAGDRIAAWRGGTADKCERFSCEGGLRNSSTGRRTGRVEMGVRVQALTEYVEDRRDRPRCGEAMGRDERFEEMVARQARFMFQVAFGLLRNRQDAEDAVQEAFLKLYRGEAWLRMENERGFLARTVWRVALDHLPKTERMSDVAEMELTASGESPEQSAVDGDERAVLRRLIDGLPEELRQPLVLSSVEEMTSREVAEVMGIPEGTVRTRVMRARGMLRRRFVAMKEGQR
jgi:RNA polymerase sigma-70 factor, ECF subfamily